MLDSTSSRHTSIPNRTRSGMRYLAAKFSSQGGTRAISESLLARVIFSSTLSSFRLTVCSDSLIAAIFIAMLRGHFEFRDELESSHLSNSTSEHFQPVPSAQTKPFFLRDPLLRARGQPRLAGPWTQ